MQHASNAPLSNKLILMVAPNGARRMKADHPAIPISAVELANCSTEILEAGASVIHLHVRDNQGRHSLDPEHYKDAIKQIKHQVGKKLIIQITTEAVGIYTIEQQIHCVREVKPEAISVALREICPDELSEHVAADFFKWCADQCIWVQIILYSVDEVLRYKELYQRGLFGDLIPSVLFVLGRYSQNLLGDPSELLSYKNELGEAIQWSCCCFGKSELTAMTLAAELGGHARIGFENNLWLPDGTLVQSNTELLDYFVTSCLPKQRKLASADDIRCWFQTK